MQKRGGGITTFRSKFLVSQYRKFRWGTLRCTRKFRVSPNFFMHKKRILLNSVENFLSHSAEKFRGHPFNVLENLGYRKILCLIRVSQFSVGNFLSHSAEKLRKGTL